VEPAGQRAHDHEVDAFVAHRAQVRKRVELLAQLEQARLRPARRGVPARPADRAEQDRVGGLDRRPSVGRERVLVLVDRVAAEGQVHLAHRSAHERRHRLDHAAGLGHHLWPDAVAGQAGDDGDGSGFGHQTSISSLSWSASIASFAWAHARRYASAEASVMSVETAWTAKVRPSGSDTTSTSPSASAPPVTAPMVYSASVTGTSSRRVM